MYTKTQLLLSLFAQYEITTLHHGEREDKIGDVFEDYCVLLLNNSDLLKKAQNSLLSTSNTDELVYKLLSKYFDNLSSILKIDATRDIEHRTTGGNSKTDVIADITYKNGLKVSLPISLKQTTADKVAMAEFDVATIVREIGINNQTIIDLMNKHQADASAKNFTAEQKQQLKTLLEPYKEKFVKWVISGSPNDANDLRFPKILLKFKLQKPRNLNQLEEIIQINCYSIDDYVCQVLYKNGNKNCAKPGGFGTGLSWTYATGSKGKKIQFKG